MDILTLRGIGLFIVAFLNLLLSLLLWNRRERKKENLYLGITVFFSALYAFACGGVYFFWVPHSINSVLWYRFTWIGASMMPPYLTFVYYFVGQTKYLKIKSFFLWLGAATICFLSLTTPYLIKSAYLRYPHIAGRAGFFDPAARLYIFICLTVGLVYLFKEYFKSQSVRRLQLRYFIIGTTTYAIVGIITAAIIPLLTKESAYYDIAAYFSFVWVALTSYAILRYRLFDIRLVLGRLAINVFTAITFIGIALLALFLNSQFDSIIPVNIIFILMLLLVIVTYSSLFRFFERVAARYFYYTFYTLQTTLTDLSKKLNQIIELDKLTNLINQSLLDSLKLDKVGIILKEPEKKTLQPQQLINLREENILSILGTKEGFLSKYLQETKEPLVREEIPFLIEEIKRKEEKSRSERVEKEQRELSSLKEEMEKTGIALFLPLLIKEELIGIIVLGNKLSGEAYTVQDLDLLTTLTSQTGIAFNNALALEEIAERKNFLERMYKATVGRELRMIELKKEIKKGEEKIKELEEKLKK